jgi:pentatricopeptide repeat protein
MARGGMMDGLAWAVRARAGMVAVLAAVLAAATASCSKTPEWIKTYFTLEGRTESMNLPPSTPEELRETVNKYRAVVEEKVDAGQKQAYYLRLLGSAYLDRAMYGEALEAFWEAAKLSPANAALFYYMGLCSGYVSKTEAVRLEKESKGRAYEYLLQSRDCYQRALDLDPGYHKAMYALAVLYAFELDEPSKAEPLALAYLETNTADDNARFVLARAYVAQGRYDEAVAVYERIISSSKNPQARADAERNRDTLLAGKEAGR